VCKNVFAILNLAQRHDLQRQKANPEIISRPQSMRQSVNKTCGLRLHIDNRNPHFLKVENQKAITNRFWTFNYASAPVACWRFALP